MESDFEFSDPVKFNGEIYRSKTEAAWARFLTRLHIPHTYEPETFRFPDGRQYTPDFLISPTNIFIEVKNGNVDETACIKANDLARFLGRHTVLIDGPPKKSNLYVFDGRPPALTPHIAAYPASHYAFEGYKDRNPAQAMWVLAQTNPYTHEGLNIPPSQIINRVAKETAVGDITDFYVSETEKQYLRNKLLGSLATVRVFEQERVFGTDFSGAIPERRITPEYPIDWEDYLRNSDDRPF